jgi:hypothetical protein
LAELSIHWSGSDSWSPSMEWRFSGLARSYTCLWLTIMR